MCLYVYIVCVYVNMVGVNMAIHDAICECFEGTVLEPCLLRPCVHVASNSASSYH